MSVNGRILSANSPVLLWLVAIAVMIVGLISFTLSFTALTGLATMARIPATVAWGWPLMVDGTIVVATFGTLVLRTRDRIATRGYPWAVLIVFGALSIYANGVHATGGRIGTTEAFVVGAVAPFALLTSTHLLVLMLTSPEKESSDSDLRTAALQPTAVPSMHEADTGSDATPTAVAAPAEPAPARAQAELATAPMTGASTAPRTPARPRPTKTSATTSKTAGMSESRVEALVLGYFDEHGSWPSGSTVGGWLGKSSKTGIRFVNKLREQHETAAATPPA